MAKITVGINKDYRDLIKQMQDNNLLGIDQSTSTKEIFMVATAMGLDNPSEVKHKDSLIRVEYLKTMDKSLMASVLLGMADVNGEIDEYADFEKAIDLCEQCAETGFLELKEIINSAGDDQELIDRRIMKKLDNWYNLYVE